jgi:hypothetical protein
MNWKVLMLSALATVAIAGCGSLSPPSEKSGTKAQEPANTAASKRDPNVIVANDGNGTVEIQREALRPGVSSATVEKMGKRAGCTGSAGAGLITQKGPSEVYRMRCDNGTSFVAKCELRQCKPLR